MDEYRIPFHVQLRELEKTYDIDVESLLIRGAEVRRKAREDEAIKDVSTEA